MFYIVSMTDTSSLAAQERLLHTIARALWEEYGYTTLSPWSPDVVGLSLDMVPPAQRRVTEAHNRCWAAARAVARGLGNTPLGDLQEALCRPDSVEPAALDIFSPIHVWADGSGTVSTSNAGCGVVFRFHGPKPELRAWGIPLGTGTNNFAELSGILHALLHLQGPDRIRPVVVHSDSQYALGAASGRNRATANVDLILALRREVVQFRSVKFVHVKGHAGVPENELADFLAGTAAKQQRRVELSEAPPRITKLLDQMLGKTLTT